MCDYSLEMYRSRPARVGEQYVTSRFRSGSIGLMAPGDCQTAVCVMADARLKFEAIPEHIQQRFGLTASEVAVFVRREIGAYRDAIRFTNGAEATLQQLGPGLKVGVIDALEGVIPIESGARVEHRRFLVD